MKDKKQYESICFQVISAAGTAKSCFLEAIEAAKAKEPYQDIMMEGVKSFAQAANAHAKALQLEAEENLDFGLLLIHAETILSSAETIRDLSGTIIELINRDKA